MDQRSRALVELVRSRPGVSRDGIAHALSVGDRTVYSLLKDCNDALAGVARIGFERAGANGSGYYLVVQDDAALLSLLDSTSGLADQTLPQSREERISYLLNDLLSRPGWIKLDELSSMLFVSRTTLSTDLRDVESALRRFGLSIEKRPRYGIRVSGSEMSRRLCLASLAVTAIGRRDRDGAASAGLDAIGTGASRETLDAVARCVDEVTERNGFVVNSLSYRNLLVHICIALSRIEEGSFVPIPASELDRLRDGREFRVAGELAAQISSTFGVDLPEAEIAYIAIHLAGKQVYSSSGDTDDLVISDEVWELVGRILELVWESFRFDFRRDLELRMNLACHIVPLSVRLRYRLFMGNPILEDTKARYPLAYSMAVDASSVLAGYYGTALPEDEIGYIALAFALAIERQRTDHPRKNIVIVCASGRGSSRLLEYRYREEFGTHLDRIQVLDVARLEHFDLTGFDYIFTTVPLSFKLPIPVREIGLFLDEDEIAGVREAIRGDGGGGPSLSRPISLERRLFFPHLLLSGKDAVLDLLCAACAREHEVDERFSDLVHERERLAPTAFGNQVALPHPVSPASDEGFMAVALLDEPVDWGDHRVRAVFLLSIARESNNEIAGFYDRFTDVIMDPAAIGTLLADQRLETLETLIYGSNEDESRSGS